MALVDELKAACYVFGRTIRELVVGKSSPLHHYVRELFIALLVVIAGVGGYVGYQWYKTASEQQAYTSFAHYSDEYQVAAQANTAADWQRIVTLLSNGYQQHKGTALAPLILSLKSDAQIQLNELVEAANTIQQALGTLSKDSKLSPLLSIKHALLLMDVSDEALQEKGLQELVSLARDNNNPYKDMALFYLGRYYWAHDQIAEAKKAWQDLEDSSWMDIGGRAYPSPWLEEVQQKLKQIII